VSASTVTEKNWAGVTIEWDNRSEQAILQTTWRRLSGCRRKSCERIGVRLRNALADVSILTNQQFQPR
jgi:hypothetical protein